MACRHAEFYRVRGLDKERDAWYSYCPDNGEQYLAPASWYYLNVLNLLSSAGWEFVSTRTVGSYEYFIVRREVKNDEVPDN